MWHGNLTCMEVKGLIGLQLSIVTSAQERIVEVFFHLDWSIGLGEIQVCVAVQWMEF